MLRIQDKLVDIVDATSGEVVAQTTCVLLAMDFISDWNHLPENAGSRATYREHLIPVGETAGKLPEVSTPGKLPAVA